jgi:hypothetical protein
MAVKYTVELYGMIPAAGGVRTVELDLDGEANLEDLVGALRRALPGLEGSVILSGEDRLAGHYTFNVNGRFHVDEYDIKVRPRDHILLLTLPVGG